MTTLKTGNSNNYPNHPTIMPKNKTRILHLIKSLGRGGAEKLLPETAALHSDGFEFFCMYFYHRESNVVGELEAAGVHVVYVPSGNLGLLWQVKKVKEFILQHDIDLVHSHLPWAGILGRLVRRKTGIPLIYTEHNTWERYNRISYWGNRLTFKLQDAAVFVSNEVALSTRLNLFFAPLTVPPPLLLKTIPNGVNTEKFKKDLMARTRVRRELGIAEQAIVVGKVAVFRSQKRLWLWVEQALEILRHHPETHFLLVGEGEWKQRIERQIEDSGQAARFHLIGMQREIVPFLSAMDIYMSSSAYEGLPVAMLEAMSCGLPVVATRAGGIGEVVRHGMEGYLCEIENHRELAPLVLDLVRDKEKRRAFGEASRKRVEVHFSLEKMVQAIEGLYGQVLERKGVAVK
ncbi:glycosyltransferase [Negadavirga shengliensis]